MKLNPYLNFGGNCQEAFEFYEKHLGGKITMKLTFGQMPGEKMAPEDWDDKICYANMKLADTELKGSDAPPDRFQPMRSVYLSLAVDSIEDAERVHAVLAEGGEIFMPMGETFFAHRFSMLRDKFGISWMILNEKPM